MMPVFWLCAVQCLAGCGDRAVGVFAGEVAPHPQIIRAVAHMGTDTTTYSRSYSAAGCLDATKVEVTRAGANQSATISYQNLPTCYPRVIKLDDFPYNGTVAVTTDRVTYDGKGRMGEMVTHQATGASKAVLIKRATYRYPDDDGVDVENFTYKKGGTVASGVKQSYRHTETSATHRQYTWDAANSAWIRHSDTNCVVSGGKITSCKERRFIKSKWTDHSTDHYTYSAQGYLTDISSSGKGSSPGVTYRSKISYLYDASNRMIGFKNYSASGPGAAMEVIREVQFTLGQAEWKAPLSFYFNDMINRYMDPKLIQALLPVYQFVQESI